MPENNQPSAEVLAERERCVAILSKVLEAGCAPQHVTAAFKAVKHGKSADDLKILPNEQ
jgi:hypothetical protein